MRKILIIVLAVTFIFTACKKTDFDTTVTGEAVGNLALLSPGNDSVTLNPATPNSTVTFRWTPAKPGVNTPVQYRVIFANRTAADFEAANRLFVTPSDNNGAASTLTLTYKQIDDLIKASTLGNATRADLKWTVEAYNDKEGSTLATASNMIVFKRSTNGATPFSILGPVTSTSSVTINPSSTADSLRFNWTRSIPATGSPAVTYRVNIYRDNSSSTPLFTMASNRSGVDTLKSISYKDFSDSLTKFGFTNISTIANLRWNVTATSGTWTENTDFTNQLYISRERNLFIVGGATPIGWSPTDALQFIEDAGRPGVYYMYTFLRGGNNGFKLLSMKADWSASGQKVMGERNEADGSGNNATNNTGNLSLTDDGRNIAVPGPDGVYRITVDLNTNTYIVQSQHGRMGIVGGGTMADWNPGAVFPSQQMGWAETNLFVGITQVTSNGEFKMLDHNDWPNGNLNYTRDYEDGGNGKLSENGGPNFRWTEATGPVRVIWD